MTLCSYMMLVREDEEITIWDSEYDMESYFYGGKPDDKWSEEIKNLSKKLSVKEIRKNGVVVNLSKVIERSLNEIQKTDLFKQNDLDNIMNSMESVLSGGVSEYWLEDFVKCLH